LNIDFVSGYGKVLSTIVYTKWMRGSNVNNCVHKVDERNVVNNCVHKVGEGKYCQQLCT